MRIYRLDSIDDGQDACFKHTQGIGDQFGVYGRILDQQQVERTLDHHGASVALPTGATAGKANQNVAPAPTLPSPQIRPPWRNRMR